MLRRTEGQAGGRRGKSHVNTEPQSQTLNIRYMDLRPRREVAEVRVTVTLNPNPTLNAR